METILFIIYFIFASFLAFYIPGRVVLGNQKNLSKIGIFAVSYVLGIVLWGWQGYLFGFLQLRNLSYLYLLIFVGLFIFKKYYSFKIPKVELKKLDFITGIMMVVGIIAQVIPYVRTGQQLSSGIFISSTNFVDHVWHATLIGELVRRFPPMEPGMYGALLTNYHFWFHLVTAELIRVFHLPLLQTQFIGMYSIASILLALLAYALAKAIYDSKLFLRLLVFFLFFGGNLGALLMLFVTHRFSFNIGWLFEDATKLMDTPGSGFAVIISLAAIYLLFKNKERIPWKTIGIIGLLFGSLMGFKIYFAIPLIIGVFCMAAFNVLKKNFSALWIFVIAVIFFLAQFVPFNSTSGGLFFLPFDIPRGFFAQPGLGLTFLDQRWGIYYAHHNTFRLIEYGVLMSIGYLLAQFGVKLFGLIPLRRTIKTTGLGLYIFLYSTVITSLILTLFFYQKVGGANIWEFLFLASLILAILVALNISLLLSRFNKIIMLVIVGIIILITIPRWAYSVTANLQDNYLSGFHGVPTSESQAFDYLKNKTAENSLVLLLGEKNYVVYSSIASVLSQRNLFLSGEGVSQLNTPEIIRRRNEVSVIKNSENQIEINTILKKDNINYIYIYNDEAISSMSGLWKNPVLKEVFSNDSGKIYKVN